MRIQWERLSKILLDIRYSVATVHLLAAPGFSAMPMEPTPILGLLILSPELASSISMVSSRGLADRVSSLVNLAAFFRHLEKTIYV